MQIEKLPLTQTGILSSMAQDYLSGKELEYSHSFDKQAIKEAIQQRDFSLDKRKVLKKSLLEDYELLFDDFKSGESHQAVYANIEKLEDEKTFTVCTGHQICVLGGPLFFMYKIAATINLAKQLQEEYPNYNFVPVYWMATEDHDFEEIRSVFLFGNSYTWNKEHQSQPVGRMNSDSFNEFLESIESQIREKDKFQSLKKLFEDSYDGKSLASATVQWVHGLFKKYGLVIIDPDKKALKKEFIPIMKDELINHSSHEEVNRQSEKLSSYNLPVSPRDINLFYLTDDHRERIVHEEGEYQVLNTEKSFSEKEIMDELNENPDSFSPNVTLRPLYQEAILPNLAYVGGTNEISYWFQLYSLFKYHGVFFPQLIVRPSGLFVGGGIAKKMKKYDLDSSELFRDRDEVIREYLSEKAQTTSLEKDIHKLEEAYEELLETCKNFESDLKWPVVNQAKQHIKDLKKLEKDTRKLLKQKNQKDINSIQKIYDSLYPDCKLQERIESFIPYYLFLGDELADLLISGLNPYDKSLSLFYL